MESDIWKLLKDNFSIILSILTIIFSVSVYIIKVDSLEKNVMAYEAKLDGYELVENQILSKLVEIQTNQENGNELLKEVRTDVKELQKEHK